MLSARAYKIPISSDVILCVLSPGAVLGVRFPPVPFCKRTSEGRETCARQQTGRAGQLGGPSLLHRDEGPLCNFMQVNKVLLRLQRKKFCRHETGVMQSVVERWGRVSVCSMTGLPCEARSR